MPDHKAIHPDFLYFLEMKEQGLIDLFKGLRSHILSFHPSANEILYHTHALTTVFSLSEKLGEAFITIPIYSEHLNLAFNKGTLLPDPHGLLKGTGKLMRHIPIIRAADYSKSEVIELIEAAIAFEIADLEKTGLDQGKTISKIKRK